jgi:hypothetical protein
MQCSGLFPRLRRIKATDFVVILNIKNIEAFDGRY